MNFVFCQKYGKNIGKNITIKNLSNKYRQKLLEHVEQSVTDALKTASKRAIQKNAEATVDLAGNKIADVTTKYQEVHHKIVQKHLKVKQKI